VAEVVAEDQAVAEVEVKPVSSSHVRHHHRVSRLIPRPLPGMPQLISASARCQRTLNCLVVFSRIMPGGLRTREQDCPAPLAKPRSQTSVEVVVLYLRRLCLLAVTPTPFGRLPSEVLEEFLSDQRAWTFADRPCAMVFLLGLDA